MMEHLVSRSPPTDIFKEEKEDADPVLKSLEDEYFGHDDITFHPEHNTIKTGSLQRLVERLTWHRDGDEIFTLTFLLTYRSFTDALELVSLLEQRFVAQMPREIATLQRGDQRRVVYRIKIQLATQQRVYSVIRIWVRGGNMERE